MSELIINHMRLREGVEIDEFARFSAEVDQPTLLAQAVVLDVGVYVVAGADPDAPAEIIEIIEVTSRDDWASARDRIPGFAEMNARFGELVDTEALRKSPGYRIRPAS